MHNYIDKLVHGDTEEVAWRETGGGDGVGWGGGEFRKGSSRQNLCVWRYHRPSYPETAQSNKNQNPTSPAFRLQ